MHPKLGRIIIPDARDLAYPMRLALPAVVGVTYRYWKTGPVLTQEGPTCVANATEGWLNASPIRTFDGPTPKAIYDAAQIIDNCGPHDGTCARSALKVLQTEGRVANYFWAESVNDVVNWILTRGSVLIGINWYSSMWTPNKAGYCVITPDAKVDGGHEVLVFGVGVGRRAFKCRNSWGSWWGLKGDFWLFFDDLERLLKEGGDAVGIVEQKV